MKETNNNKEEKLMKITIFSKRFYEEAEKLIKGLEKNGLHSLENELILYWAWRWVCRANDDNIRRDVANFEHEDYWEFKAGEETEGYS